MSISIPLGPLDSDGRQIIRPATAQEGATMYYSGPDFFAAQPNSLSWAQRSPNPPFTNSNRDWASISLFDANGNLLDFNASPSPVESDVQFTCVDVEIEKDIELIGGALANPNVLPTGSGDSDWRIWVYVAPDIPAALGGSIGFVEDIVLSDFYEGEDIVIDGRSPKLLRYFDLSNVPAIQYGMSLHNTASTEATLQGYLDSIGYDGSQHTAGDLIVLDITNPDTTQWQSFKKKSISPYAGDATDFEAGLLNNGWYENKIRFIIKHPTGLNPSGSPADKAHFQITFDAYIKW